MVAFIPEGVYTMKDKSVIINHNAKAYQKASKKIKSRMLQELSEILHMNRQYLATLLRKAGHVIFRRGRLTAIADPSMKELSKRGRKRLYGEDVIKALKKIWRISGFVYRKNDAPFVESKNWSMVRAYTGWRRYDAGEELDILQRLLRVVSLKQNLFMPQMKLIHRHREGGKIVKAYEMDIPLNRVLRVDTVDASKKTELIRLRNTIDIVALSEKIEELSEALAGAYEKKLRRHKYA
jgi:hypothetical protein